MKTFSAMHDGAFVDALKSCRRRVMYAAPRITQPVAAALGQCLDRDSSIAVTLILDADPEVYRLGYGTVEGLNLLREITAKHHLVIRSEPGLRVGVFEVDDSLWVYAPTPLLIEGGSRLTQQTNAILLGETSSTEILSAAAAEGSSDTPLASDAEIGRMALTTEKVAETLAELDRMPPKPFDVARIERVFSMRLQYVELAISNYKLSTRRIQIPNDLLIGEDPELQARLRNTFGLLEGREAIQVDIPMLDPNTLEPALNHKNEARSLPYTEKQLEADRKAVSAEFLTNIEGYGLLIKRWERAAFERRVEWLRRRMDAYRDGVRIQLEDAIEHTIDRLASKLLEKRPGVDQLPGRIRKKVLIANPDQEHLLALLTDEVRRFIGVADVFFNPEIKVTFKDLTHETIQQQEFRAKLEKAYGVPGRPSVFEQLYEEYDAAREVYTL